METKMKPKLGPHLISQHWSQLDEDMLNEWQPESIKMVWVGLPAHIDSILRLNPKFVIIRDYELADAGQHGITTHNQAVQRGREHAEVHHQLAEKIEQQFGYPRSKVLFEGWNEPPIWQGEFYKLVDAYEAMRMTAVSAWGGRCIVGNLNTGHPDNSGSDTDPNWFWFPLMKNVLESSMGRHGLGLHEYCAFVGPEAKRPNGVGGWSWDMGRYTRNHWSCDIYLTEIGTDEAVYQGGHQGWQKLPLPDMESRARKYTDWLLWYAKQLAKDERVKGAYIFTHDSQSPDWLSFDTRNESFWRVFVPTYYAADFPDPQPTPMPSPDWLVDVVDMLPKHPTKRYQRRTAKVDGIAIHHSAGAVTGDLATPEGLARLHITERDWPGIAYHVVVTPNGAAYLTNRLSTMSFHVANENDHLIGCCFVGDFTRRDPTAAQLAAGRKVLSWLYGQLGLDGSAVQGHGNFPNQTTACPGGDWWRALLDAPPQPTLDPVLARAAAFASLGIALNPESAFYKEARKRALGRPVTGEIDLGEYRLQGFDKAVLACRIGDWGNMQQVEWL